MFGGRGYEEVTSGNLELTSQFLLTNDNNFLSLAIDSAVYVLIKSAGTYAYTIDFVLFDGTMNGNVADTVITTTDWSVVKIPINPVDETYKSTVTIGIDDIDLTTDFISDLYTHEQIEEFVFLCRNK